MVPITARRRTRLGIALRAALIAAALACLGYWIVRQTLPIHISVPLLCALALGFVGLTVWTLHRLQDTAPAAGKTGEENG